MNSIRQVHNDVYNFYLQTASNIVTHCDDNSQKEMLKELTEMVKTSCILDIKLKESHDILQRLTTTRNDCNENPEVPDHKETLQQFNNEIAGINSDVSKQKNFLDFKAQIKALLDDKKSKDHDGEDDAELILTQKEMTVIDPVTKKRITDPVKNTVCGHVYDRESITALLQGNKHTKCPVVGCRDKKFVQLKNLQTDILTKKYLDRNPGLA